MMLHWSGSETGYVSAVLVGLLSLDLVIPNWLIDLLLRDSRTLVCLVRSMDGTPSIVRMYKGEVHVRCKIARSYG